MVTLKEALETAQLDVQVLEDERPSMTRPLGLLGEAISSLPGSGNEPVLLAKDACETLSDRACEAEGSDFPGIAKRLRGIVRDLSSVVDLEYRSL